MRHLLITLLFAGLGCAQAVDSNAITVTVSRSIDIPAEQAQFRLAVYTDPTVDLSTVQNTLRTAGISGASFTGLTNTPTADTSRQLTWNFQLVVAYGKVGEQFAILQKAASPARKRSSLNMSFSLGTSSVSAASMQDAENKLIPDLIADARKQAAALAGAVNLTVGQVLAISDQYDSIPIAVSRSGDFASFLLGSSGSVSPTYTVTYTITVKFAALRYS